MTTARVLPLLALLSGCALDFDQFLTASDASARADTVVEDTGTTPPEDAPPATDAPPQDTGRPDTAPVDRPTPPPPCPLPWLAATVENLSGSGGGRVVRVSLASGERCSDFGEGILSAQPMAVTQLPSGELAVAARDGLSVLDRGTGALVRSFPWPDAIPLDAFPVRVGTTDAVAVAMTFTGSAEPEAGDVVVTDGRTMVARWSRGTNFPISVRSMAAHPSQPNQYLALRSEGRTLALTAATSGMHASVEAAELRNGIDSLHTLVTPTGRYLAWTYQLSGQLPRVILTSPGATTTRFSYSFNQVLGCGAPACARFLRAVGDPRDDQRGFALCEVAGSGVVRHVVRIGPSSDCTLLDGSTLAGRARISHLTVVAR